MQKTVTPISVQASIAENYGELSVALKMAAGFAVKNSVEIASQSFQLVVAEIELSPSSFSRLARATSYQDYDQLCEHAREELASSTN